MGTLGHRYLICGYLDPLGRVKGFFSGNYKVPLKGFGRFGVMIRYGFRAHGRGAKAAQ